MHIFHMILFNIFNSFGCKLFILMYSYIITCIAIIYSWANNLQFYKVNTPNYLPTYIYKILFTRISKNTNRAAKKGKSI